MPTVFPRSAEIASRVRRCQRLRWQSSHRRWSRRCQRTRRSQPYLSAARPYWMSCSQLTNREVVSARTRMSRPGSCRSRFPACRWGCDGGCAAGKELGHLPRSDTVQRFVIRFGARSVGPNSAAKHQDRITVTPSDRAGELGSDQFVVAGDQIDVHAAQLFQPAVLGGIGKHHLIASMVERLLLR